MGIEPNLSARTLANSKIPNTVFDVDTLQTLPEKSFDVITLWHVLEHLPNLEEDVKTIHKLLKPNGRIVVAVPNFKSFDADYFKSFWAAYDVPRHLWHFSQNSISKVFSKVQIETESTLPLVMDAYYVSLLSNKLKTGSYRILNSLWIGFLSNLKALKSGEYSSLIYVLKSKNQRFKTFSGDFLAKPLTLPSAFVFCDLTPVYTIQNQQFFAIASKQVDSFSL